MTLYTQLITAFMVGILAGLLMRKLILHLWNRIPCCPVPDELKEWLRKND